MLFTHPLFLWLLPLAALLPILAWRAVPRRRWTVALLRAAAVACLVFAASHPLWLPRRSTPIRVAVVDVSPTVTPSAILSTGRELGADVRIVACANRAVRVARRDDLADPARLASLRRRLDAPLWPDDPVGGGSALADALRLAGALVPWGEAGAIDVYTNGLCTRGDPAAEAVRLGRRGISVRVMPLPVQPSGPPVTTLVRSFTVPPTGRVGQSLPAILTIESTTSGRVHVTLRDGEAVIGGGDIEVTPGLNRAVVPLPLTRPGVLTARATLTGPSADPTPAVAAVLVQGPMNVLVVRDPSQPDATAATLTSILGPSSAVREVGPAALDTPASLDGASLVFLSNVPASELSTTAQARLHDAVVSDGKSLVVCGEERSFGSGGYADSPVLEPMLPVRMPRPTQQLDPSVALVLVIDTSGSMLGARIDLAKEVARLAINRLQPTDKAGIVEFFANRRWAAPLQTVGDQADIDRELDRLSAGGGTVLYPAVEEAAFALRNVPARSRQVLILSDGDVENTPFESLVRQMRKDGILVSCGRCGNPNGEGEFLSNIAHWGGGRYYQVDDRFELPDLTFKRPRLLPMSPVVFQTEGVRLGDDPLARSFDRAIWPPVTQFVRTPAKPTADVLLSTAGGDPLLARWRYGAGWVVAMSVSPGTPAALPLESSPEFGPMLRTLADSIAPAPDGLRVRPIPRPAGVEVAIDAMQPDAALTTPVLVTLRSGGAAVRSSQTPPMAVGKWDVLFPGVPAGTYRVDAAVGGPGSDSPAKPATGSAALAVPVPRALWRLTPDSELLSALAASPVEPGPTSPVQPIASGPIVALWIPLALLSLVLFLLHVAARRYPDRPAQRRPPVGAAAMPPASPGPRMAAVPCVALLFGIAAVARGGEPPTTAATQTSSVQERLRAELIRTGDVQTLADDLARQRPNEPAGRQRWIADRAALAWEQGDLHEEASLLQALAAARPDDVEVDRRLAVVDDLAGDDDGAEQNWRRVLSLRPSPAVAENARLHLAVLLLDGGQTQTGFGQLAQTESDGRLPLAAGIVAMLYGQDALATELLPSTPATRPADAAADRLSDILGAEANLRLHHSAVAETAFRHARLASTQPADQRYLAQREVAASKQDGTSIELADRWLGEGDHLPIACIAPLAGVLRDTGQVDRLLAWWSALAASPDEERRNAALARKVSAETVGAAADAGRGKDAQAVVAQVLRRNPHSLIALNTAVRVALDLDDPPTADALLNERVDAAEDADDLRSLGDLAAALGRQTVTLRCAGLLERMGGADAVSGLLLRASLLASQADVSGQIQLLERAAGLTVDAGQAQVVADALDAAGRSEAAIALLQRITARGAPSAPSDAVEDPLNQLAWLLEKAGRLPEAVAVWQRLWESADTPAGHEQAERRLIKLAATAGTLSTLRDQAAARLQDGRGTAADLSLLVDADVRAGDIPAAIQAVRTSAVAGTATDRLQAIGDIDLRTNRTEDAASALQQLSAAQASDPAARRLTLERLAEVDLRLRRADAAQQAIDAAAQGSDSATAASLLAGIYSRTARPLSAARQYRRAIAAEEGSSEQDQWLLWAQAMSRAGRRGTALARLQLLCVDAAGAGNDSLLGVGVDGLLNLDAPAEVLRPVRRLVVLRLAAVPQRTLDGRLLSDLSNPLGDATLGRRAMEVSLAAETQERSEHLRTLIDAARAAGQTDATRDYSERLLALGEDLPPSLFLDLGEQFLADGQDEQAVRALVRATEATTDDVVRRRAAAALERANLPLPAARLLAPQAERLPGDVPLQLEWAGCYESAQQDARAESLYAAALQIGLKRIVADAAMAGADGVGGPTTGQQRHPTQPPGRPPARPMNLEPAAPAPLPDDIRLPLQGALTCAGDNTQKQAVLQAVATTADQLLSDHGAARAAPPPDVLLAAAALRFASFSAGEPDLADGFDRRLLQRWPGATELRETVVQTRLWWGLYDRAARFVQGSQAMPPLLKLRAACAEPAATTRPLAASRPSSLAAAPPGADLAEMLLPQLLIRGRLAEASQVLAGLPPQNNPSTVASEIVVGSAYELGRPSVIDAMATAWCHGLAAQPGSTSRTGRSVAAPAVPAFVRFQQTRARWSALSEVWPVVSPAVRRELIPLIAGAAISSDDPQTAAQLAHFALAAAAQEQVALPEAADLAVLVTGKGATHPRFYFDTPAMLALLKLSPVESRGEIARRALASGDPTERATWALQCIGGATLPLGEAAVNALIDAAKTPPAPPPVPASDVAAVGEHVQGAPPVRWVVWFDNPAQAAATQQMCDALLRTAATDPEHRPGSEPQATGSNAAPTSSPSVAGLDVQTLVSVAAAQSALGHARRADDLATAAIQRLRDEPPTDPEADVRLEPDARSNAAELPQPVSRLTLLQVAVGAQSTDSKQRLAGVLHGDAATALDVGGWGVAAEAALLEAVGERGAALRFLRAAYERHPHDRVVLAALERRLRADGRDAELATLLHARLYDTGSADATMLPELITALDALGRRGEVRQLLFAGEPPTDSLARQMKIAVADGQPARAGAAFRSLLIAERSGDLSPAALGIPQPDAGGLLGFEQQPGAAAAFARRQPACLSPSHAGGVDVLLREFAFLSPEKTTGCEALAQMLADSAARDPAARELMLHHLADLQRRQALRVNDRLLALRLATTPGVLLPLGVGPALWDVVLLRAEPGRGDLAAALAMQGDVAAAQPVERWAAALQTALGHAVDNWVETTDRDDRAYTPAFPPTPSTNDPTGSPPRPAQTVNDVLEASRLVGLIRHGERSAAREEFDALADEQRLAVGSDPQTMLVGARLAADDGDAAEFGRRLGRVLDHSLWRSADRLLDIRAALPSCGEGSVAAAAVTAAALTAIDTAADRWPGNTDLCRQRCIVGTWAADCGDAIGADHAWADAMRQRDRLGAGEYELWIADLADRLGRQETSLRIQTDMLQDQRLPLPRIAPLLETLVHRGDLATAHQLAGVAASMTGSTPSRMLQPRETSNPATRDAGAPPATSP